MIIKARFGVQLDGHIFQKGETLDYKGVITQRIVDNFTAEDGAALALDGDKEIAAKAEANPVPAPADADKAKIAKVVEVMKREGIVQALEGMGITFSPKSKTDYLGKLLLISRGEIEE